MELESITFSTHPPFIRSSLTTLTTIHFTRICSKQYPSQLEEKSPSLLYLSESKTLRTIGATNQGGDWRYNDWSVVTVPEIDLNHQQWTLTLPI
ncbi:hypothetical protein Hanom_Chr07g00664931 [Helianthus anomalus]